MFEFLFGYWIGRDSQKDPKGTFIALAIVPPGLLFAFWAYYAFVGFIKLAWSSYLNYSSQISMNVDFIVLVVLFILNFSTLRYIGESKETKHQIIQFIEKSVSAIVLPWVLFDLLYKSQFLEKLQMQIFGSVTSPVEPLMFFMSGQVSLYNLIVGTLLIATILMPFVLIGAAAFIVYQSKKNASADSADVCR